MTRKTALFFIIIILGFALTGCWGQREINELGIVQVTGVDKEPDGKFRITVMAVIPIGAATGESMNRSGVWVGSAVGTSMSEASRNLRSTASKRLVWVDNKIFVIGEELARQGLDEFMDYFMRNRELRYRNFVMVSKGKAMDVLSIPSDIEENLPIELQGMIQNTEEWAKAYIPDMKDFSISYLDKRIEAVAGRLTYYETDMNTFSTAREHYYKMETNGNRKKIAAITGSAVFKGSKLVGWLGEEETKAYRWIIGEVTSGIATIRKNKQMVSIEIRDLNTDIKAVVEEDAIQFTIKLELSGEITEYIDQSNVLDEYTVKNIEKNFEDFFKKEMEKTVKKAQKEYRSDFLGFGRILYREYPNTWRKIEKDWDKIFPRVEIAYKVKVTVDRMGERF
ncbi:MAG: Ger(x)C family spore germination protein [Bacillota bacterium]